MANGQTEESRNANLQALLDSMVLPEVAKPAPVAPAPAPAPVDDTSLVLIGNTEELSLPDQLAALPADPAVPATESAPEPVAATLMQALSSYESESESFVARTVDPESGRYVDSEGEVENLGHRIFQTSALPIWTSHGYSTDPDYVDDNGRMIPIPAHPYGAARRAGRGVAEVMTGSLVGGIGFQGPDREGLGRESLLRMSKDLHGAVRSETQRSENPDQEFVEIFDYALTQSRKAKKAQQRTSSLMDELFKQRGSTSPRQSRETTQSFLVSSMQRTSYQKMQEVVDYLFDPTSSPEEFRGQIFSEGKAANSLPLQEIIDGGFAPLVPVGALTGSSNRAAGFYIQRMGQAGNNPAGGKDARQAQGYTRDQYESGSNPPGVDPLAPAGSVIKGWGTPQLFALIDGGFAPLIPVRALKGSMGSIGGYYKQRAGQAGNNPAGNKDQREVQGYGRNEYESGSEPPGVVAVGRGFAHLDGGSGRHGVRHGLQGAPQNVVYSYIGRPESESDQQITLDAEWNPSLPARRPDNALLAKVESPTLRHIDRYRQVYTESPLQRSRNIALYRMGEAYLQLGLYGEALYYLDELSKVGGPSSIPVSKLRAQAERLQTEEPIAPKNRGLRAVYTNGFDEAAQNSEGQVREALVNMRELFTTTQPEFNDASVGDYGISLRVGERNPNYVGPSNEHLTSYENTEPFRVRGIRGQKVNTEVYGTGPSYLAEGWFGKFKNDIVRITNGLEPQEIQDLAEQLNQISNNGKVAAARVYRSSEGLTPYRQKAASASANALAWDQITIQHFADIIQNEYRYASSVATEY